MGDQLCSGHRIGVLGEVSSWGPELVATRGRKFFITDDGTRWRLAFEKPDGGEFPHLRGVASGPLIVTGSCGVYTSPDAEECTLWEDTLDCPAVLGSVSIAWGRDRVEVVGQATDADYRGKSVVRVGQIVSS